AGLPVTIVVQPCARPMPTSEIGVLRPPVESAQYTSSQYRRLADRHGVQLSVGRKGQCWDNAVAESFFATIKTELLDRRPWPTRASAQRAIFAWIEGWYNTRRRHSTLDYDSPAAYEAKLYNESPLRQVA
ncbi:integrase core domain-containing protein, partial [Dactylosporangium sp. NPDC005555]|uniref:integrase core domain-containing protein n=1 Tax=Dactylosporangium sp. NPDC005555 TaxID=3154889 RepID=UPI0033A57972